MNPTENGLTPDEMKVVLDRASRLYAKGNSDLTDFEFDAIKADWEKATGETYFWSDVETGDVEHSRPMLSLEKAKEVGDITKFFKGRNETYVVKLPKIDGLAQAITYKRGRDKGHICMGLTRGKRVGGVTYGNVVTDNIKKVAGVEASIELAAGINQMEIRGEVYMPEVFFEKANEMRRSMGKEPFENVRNAAAGILRNEDGHGLEFLRFVAYNAFRPDVPAHEDKMFDRYDQVLDWLHDKGFDVPQSEVVRLDQVSLETLHNFNDNNLYPFQTDGVVVVLNDMNLHRGLGSNRSHPLHSIAFKFEDETAEATLLGVRWTATRTGRVMPTFFFTPVRLEGTTVENATGHNLKNVLALNVRVNDKIEVYKAHMIIPQVKRLVERVADSTEIEIPIECPSCKHPTTRNAVDLLCENEACPAKLVQTLVNAANRKNWDIDILGESVAEALVASELVTNLSHLFYLKNFKHTLAGLKLGEKGVNFGASRAQTLLDEIEKAKTKPWAVTLHALGCPGLGEPECKALAQRYSLNDLLRRGVYDLDDTLMTELLAIKGMGKKTAETLLEWLGDNQGWLAEIDQVGLQTEKGEAAELASTILDGKTVVVTGTHSVPRHVIEKLVTDNGGSLSGSVSKKTDYLVAGDDAGSKLAKAQEVNAKAKTDADRVAIISYLELLELLK